MQVLVIFDTGTTGASLTTSSPAAIKEKRIVSRTRLAAEAVNTKHRLPICQAEMSFSSRVSALWVLTGGVKGRV